jgi:hypothetical protein
VSIPSIHQFLGYLMPTVAAIGFVLSLFARQPESGARRYSLVFLRIFVILLSIQWLLGVINYFMFPAGARPSLVHPLWMTVVVAAVHILAGRARRDPASGWGLTTGTFVGSAVLIWIGLGLV